jgi:hypothetical protein
LMLLESTDQPTFSCSVRTLISVWAEILNQKFHKSSEIDVFNSRGRHFLQIYFNRRIFNFKTDAIMQNNAQQTCKTDAIMQNNAQQTEIRQKSDKNQTEIRQKILKFLNS